jgi:GNAT superfamily N-acetyltransferase
MDGMTTFYVNPARTDDDYKATILLFTAYAESLGIDLSFQNFKAELDAMPGKYSPPMGEILLARTKDGTAVGCAALRPLSGSQISEVKRLYVSPSGRGLGIGKELVKRIVQVAEELGYLEMRLDTLPHMSGAIALYEKAGFVRIPAYYETPLAETIFLAKVLSRSV